MDDGDANFSNEESKLGHPVPESVPSDGNTASTRPKRAARPRIPVSMYFEDGSDDDMEPPAKKPKLTVKKSTSKVIPPKVVPSVSAESSPKPTPKKSAPKPKVTSPKPDIVDSITSAKAIIANAARNDSAAQYDGIPLEQLRQTLSPQEYVRISILRSMAESSHAASGDKNVSRKVHPDLAPAKPVALNWESELKHMISTWVHIDRVPTTSLAILEAEATRYTTQLVKELSAIVQEDIETGAVVNGRRQKPLMYSAYLKPTFDNVTSIKALDPAPAADEEPEITADDPEQEEDYVVAQDDNAGVSGNKMVVAEESNLEDEQAGPGTCIKVPIASPDLLAEVLVRRHVSLIRRLQYISKRLAEDAQARRTQEEAEKGPTKVNEDGERRENGEEGDEELLEAWVPSEELEAYVLQQDSSETMEKQHTLRESQLSERMVRVEGMPNPVLEDWQVASSISFVRPRRLRKFKAWLAMCCSWDVATLCIPVSVIVLINFLTYEHLRYIVRTCLRTLESPTQGTLTTLSPEVLRSEITKRIEAGDRVQTTALS